MGHLDLLKLSFASATRKQLRSWLTVLGIVIGIGAIVALVSIGQGLGQYINDQFNMMGTDFVNVQPGSPDSQFQGNPMLAAMKPLTENDRKAIEGVGGVKKAYGSVNDLVSMDFGDQQGRVTAVASTEGTFEAFPFYTIESGRFYRANSGELVLGHDVAENTFKKKIRVGDSVKLSNTSFRVVGILKEMSGLYGAANSMVLLDTQDLARVLGKTRVALAYEEINVKLEPGANPDVIGKEIELKLRNQHRVTEETQDFTVITPSYITDTANSILGTLNLFLGGLAGISLVVGGIGIANTMFMSVMERTREIGVMKAIGATERSIMELFIIESGMFGLIGGLLGCLLGLGVSLLMNQFGVPSKVDLQLVLYAMSFALAVGIVSGFFPARRAAKLEPVEALRYE